MKIKYWIVSTVSLCLVSLLMFLMITGRFFEQPLYIALVGPMDNANGEAMKQGVQLYLDKINRKGGINGRPILLQGPFNDQDTAETDNKQALKSDRLAVIEQDDFLESVAKQIVKSDALAVIGHYSSEPSNRAAPIYKGHIPAITGTATADKITKGNNWYFRVIFNNSDQGAVVANYVRKVLKKEKAFVFFDEDAYGKTLASTFTKTAKRIQLNVEEQWQFNLHNFEDKLDLMVSKLKTLSKKDDCLLFLATHSQEAIKTIKRLSFLDCKIIGGDALASSYFLETFNDKDSSNKKTYPSYYTDGLYSVSPFLVNFAGKRAQDFQKAFLKAYPGRESHLVTAAMYYDAAMVAVDAIQKTLAEEQALEAEKTWMTQLKNRFLLKESAQYGLKEKRRERVKYHLRHLSQLDQALEGVTGDLYFDKNGDAIKSIPIAVYKNGQLFTAFDQYQPIADLRHIDNVLQKILDNEIIQVNDRFMHKAHIIHVGIDINDIRELDVKKSIYTIDFYLWFRFKADAYEDYQEYAFDCINFINIFDPKHNKLEKSLSGEQCGQAKKDEGESITTTYRLKTKFKIDLDFKDYPLDKQTLFVKFRHKGLTTQELIYVVDTLGMNIVQLGKQSIADKIQIEKPFSMGGWKVNEVSFFQNSQKNDSTFGEPKLFDLQQRLEYSQFNFEIEIARHLGSFIIKNLLPIIFVIGLGYAVYFTDVFSIKMSLSINVILATSLFHLKLASSTLANVEYNTLIENLFYLVYLLGIAGVVMALIFNFENDAVKSTESKLDKLKEAKEPDEKAITQLEEEFLKGKRMIRSIDMTGRLAYPVILVIFIVMIFYQYYF